MTSHERWIRIPFLFLAVMLFAAVPLFSQTLSFGTLEVPVELTNDIEEDFLETISIQILHSGAAVDYFVTLSTGDSDSFDSRLMSDGWLFFTSSLDYQVYKDETKEEVIKDTSVANLSYDDVLYGSFAEDEASQIQTMTFCVPAGQFPKEGDPSDSLTLTLYQGTPDNYVTRSKDTDNFTVSCSIPYYTKAAIVPVGDLFTPSGRSFSMDFGTLFWGETLEADMMIRSNLNYRFTLNSENGGVLMQEDSNSWDEIPYILTFDGEVLDMSQSDVDPLGFLSNPTEYEGERYRVSVTIDEYGSVEAGTYTDVITITVTSWF